MDISESFFPATTNIAYWAYEQSGRGGRNARPQHGLPLANTNLTMVTAEFLICQ